MVDACCAFEDVAGSVAVGAVLDARSARKHYDGVRTTAIDTGPDVSDAVMLQLM